MKLVINLLTTIYGFYKKVITPPDYAIIREELEYNVDPGTKYEVDDEFWARESEAWDDLDPEEVVWMPAHTTASSVGVATLSNGAKLTEPKRTP